MAAFRKDGKRGTLSNRNYEFRIKSNIHGEEIPAMSFIIKKGWVVFRESDILFVKSNQLLFITELA